MENIILKASDFSFWGVDDWDRAIFRNSQTKRFYCFVDRLYSDDESRIAMNDLFQKNYTLYAKGEHCDGEPDYPVDYLV